MLTPFKNCRILQAATEAGLVTGAFLLFFSITNINSTFWGKYIFFQYAEIIEIWITYILVN